MQVLAAVAPAADVDAADVAERADLPLDPGQQDAELGGELVAEVARLGVVLARLEQDDERQSGRPVEGPEAPVLVRPEVLVVGGRAAAAVDPALTVARALHGFRGQQRARSQRAFERERLPLLDGRHLQRVLGARVELLGCLRHG